MSKLVGYFVMVCVLFLFFIIYVVLLPFKPLLPKLTEVLDR